jgi:hypothetical protein
MSMKRAVTRRNAFLLLIVCLAGVACDAAPASNKTIYSNTSNALSTAFLKNGHKAYPLSYNWLREQPCIAESGLQTSLREQAPAKAHFL